ncbi:hypothetical protein NP493_3751g00006 [Ridgeia piscesae]|uniref:guanylate cyclase n=1 Tax=Ridgeia piscesae TaxID=27915 RepID=A0AAD9J510_RIDPI|nr:hypothetical protein NP493_3751g00006 [Ridgeia piscesae]
MVTPKADVYSFGIILYETMFRNSPYDTEGDMAMSPEDVVARVRYGERPPYRPRIPEPNQLKPEVVDLMLDCWREKPNDRPDFSLIKKQYKDMNKGMYVRLRCVFLCTLIHNLSLVHSPAISFALIPSKRPYAGCLR